jgi:hypothetical protein
MPIELACEMLAPSPSATEFDATNTTVPMPMLFAVLFADVSQLKPYKQFELPVVSKSPASAPQIVFKVPLV